MSGVLDTGNGVIALSEVTNHRELVRSAVRRGTLEAVLPGIYAAAGQAGDPLTKVHALAKYDPTTVFTGRTAAGLLWKPELLNGDIEACARLRTKAPGYRLQRRTIDPEWVTFDRGLACVKPEVAALDVVPDLGAELIDDLLRRANQNSAEQLDRLWQALRAHPSMPGNKLREQVLRESRDRPWSEAERRAHQLLREGGITGWVTNHPVHDTHHEYLLDIAFCRHMLALEIDGFENHGTRTAFETDRERNNALTLAGWTLLHFTWTMLTERPDCFVETVRRALNPLEGA